jgi:hypothetical protein
VLSGEAEGEVAEPAGGAAEEEVGDEEGDAFGGGHGGILRGKGEWGSAEDRGLSSQGWKFLRRVVAARRER